MKCKCGIHQYLEIFSFDPRNTSILSMLLVTIYLVTYMCAALLEFIAKLRTSLASELTLQGWYKFRNNGGCMFQILK